MKILGRIVRLLPELRLVGWIVILWTLLSQASTAQFTMQLFTATSSWLDKHAWAGFVIGFGLLALAVAWETFEQRIPDWLKYPRTTASRVDALEPRIIKLEEVTASLRTQLIAVGNAQASLITRLPENFEQIPELINGVSKRIDGMQGWIDRANLLGRISGLSTRLDEHRSWIADLEKQIKKL